MRPFGGVGACFMCRVRGLRRFCRGGCGSLQTSARLGVELALRLENVALDAGVGGAWQCGEAQADAAGLQCRFFHTNHEGEFVEHLHRLESLADGLILNPGAWTHYSWAIRDAVELFTVPFVEVHLSDIDSREEWRRFSVLEGLPTARIVGKGPDGYREALDFLVQGAA